jgi:hypothetical protein
MGRVVDIGEDESEVILEIKMFDKTLDIRTLRSVASVTFVEPPWKNETSVIFALHAYHAVVFSVKD